MRSRLLICFFLLSFALASQQTAAQLTPDTGPANFGPGNLRLHGRVHEAQSNVPLENARIVLHSFAGPIVAITSTNSNGEFAIPGLKTGNYVIQAELQGFRTASETLEIMSMEGMMDIVLFLQREADPKPRAPADPISMHLLGLPTKVRDVYVKGTAELYDRKNPEASLPYFEQVLKEAPDFYEASFQLGVAYRKLGRNEQAEPAFRKTIELSKGHFPEANFRLASLLVDLKKYAEAETAARQGLEAQPKSWLGNFELGRALASLHKPDEAEKCVRTALETNPELAKAYLLLANLHLGRKESAAVVEDLDNYLRLVPQGPQSDQARQVREQAQRELDQAKKSSSTAAPPPPN